VSDLFSHPLWRELRPYVREQSYDRDGGHAHPRHRYEVRDLPPELHQQALAMEVACCACGKLTHPVRSRKGKGDHSLFLSVSCLLAVNVGCARGSAARDAYKRLASEVGNK
jgi:hypothetical protein